MKFKKPAPGSHPQNQVTVCGQLLYAVSAVKVLTVNVMEEANEELPNFTISFENDLAVLQASKRDESQRNQK